MLPRTPLLCFCLLIAAVDAFTSVALRGKITCNGVEFRYADLKLYDHQWLFPDVLLASSQTDRKGEYSIFGFHHELNGFINPYMLIYHRCGSLKEEMRCSKYWLGSDVVKKGKEFDPKNVVVVDIELLDPKLDAC